MGTWPSLQLQSMQFMSRMSSIGKRPRRWREMYTRVMAHQVRDHHNEQRRQLTTSYNILLNYPRKPHIQYYLFSIVSYLPQVPSPLFLFFTPPHLLSLALIHSSLYLFNPNPLMLCKHIHTHTHTHTHRQPHTATCIPAHAFFPPSPPPYLCI